MSSTAKPRAIAGGLLHISVATAVMISLCLFCFTFQKAQATTIASDPLVYTVVDKTHQQHTTCVLSHTVEQNSRKTTTTLPCPAGTLWSFTMTKRSQALKLHARYVTVPPANASKDQWSLFYKQLKVVKQQVLGNVSLQQVSPLISTPCNASASNSLTWSDSWNYVTIYSTVHFYIYANPHCNQVLLENASMSVTGVGSTPVQLQWTHDLYAGAYYGVPGSPNIVHGGYFSHGVNQTNTRGYTYENWVWNSVSGSWSYNDIPVN